MEIVNEFPVIDITKVEVNNKEYEIIELLGKIFEIC